MSAYLIENFGSFKLVRLLTNHRDFEYHENTLILRMKQINNFHWSYYMHKIENLVHIDPNLKIIVKINFY